MVQFCSQLSLAAGDPLAGTGAHPACNLLLSWPSGDWTKAVNTAKGMSDQERSLIAGLAASGRRVNLIDRKGEAETGHRVYLMPEGLAFTVPRRQLTAFFIAVRDGVSLDAWRGEALDRPLILCCTHGKKDRCCAKFGNAAYQAIVAASQQLARPLDVWQSSHLGGCRLSASVLEFPALRKYGRIVPDQADAFVRAVDQDKPFLPCYRGYSQWTALQQTAEVAARHLLARHRIAPESLVITEEQENDSAAQLTLAWSQRRQHGWVEIQLSASEVVRLGTCAAIDDDETPVPQPVWQVDQANLHQALSEAKP